MLSESVLVIWASTKCSCSIRFLCLICLLCLCSSSHGGQDIHLGWVVNYKFFKSYLNNLLCFVSWKIAVRIPSRSKRCRNDCCSMCVSWALKKDVYSPSKSQGCKNGRSDPFLNLILASVCFMNTTTNLVIFRRSLFCFFWHFHRSFGSSWLYFLTGHRTLAIQIPTPAKRAAQKSSSPLLRIFFQGRNVRLSTITTPQPIPNVLTTIM